MGVKVTNLNFQIPFLDVHSLEQRWKCGINLIRTLAETRRINFYLRPVALELALRKIAEKVHKKNYHKLLNSPLDHRDIYLMFKDQESSIPIKKLGNRDIGEILETAEPPNIYADFSDLVIPVEKIETFECKHVSVLEQNTKFRLLAPDFSCFILKGKEYKFGDMAAKIIKLLWDAKESGNPWVYGKILLASVNSGSQRIQSVFNHNPNWKKVILSDGKGKYRLNIAL